MSAVSPTDGTHPHCGHSRDASNAQQLVLINNKIRKTAARLAPLLGADGVRAATTSAWVLLAAPARWCGGPAWVGLLNAPFPNLGSRAGAQPETETIRAQPKHRVVRNTQIRNLVCVTVQMSIWQLRRSIPSICFATERNVNSTRIFCEDHLMKPGSSLLSVSGTIGVARGWSETETSRCVTLGDVFFLGKMCI